MESSTYHKIKSIHRFSILATCAGLYLLIVLGCGGEPTVARETAYAAPPKQLPPMRHSIQVGAFAEINNAVRYTAKLQTKGLNAYHFRHDSGLYKVRFGNYASKDSARRKAENLKASGMIEEYYIVGPQDYAALSYRTGDNDYIRSEIVRTAKQYIGIPYRWGGESPRTGFDCSGLTMVVYRLNGLDLPRSSIQQWRFGRPVKRSELNRGDLVFFATSAGRRVSHVGIYTGNGRFLHAPRRGRNIQMSSLSNTYYKKRYLGARSYL
jgi:cell wall-associated NlpC family hydrolase